MVLRSRDRGRVGRRRHLWRHLTVAIERTDAVQLDFELHGVSRSSPGIAPRLGHESALTSRISLPHFLRDSASCHVSQTSLGRALRRYRRHRRGIALVRVRQSRQRLERFAAAALETLLNAIDANDATPARTSDASPRYALILAEAAGLDEHEHAERRTRRALSRHRKDPRSALRHHPRRHHAHSRRAARDRHAPTSRRRGAAPAREILSRISPKECSPITNVGTAPAIRAELRGDADPARRAHRRHRRHLRRRQPRPPLPAQACR